MPPKRGSSSGLEDEVFNCIAQLNSVLKTNDQQILDISREQTVPGSSGTFADGHGYDPSAAGGLAGASQQLKQMTEEVGRGWVLVVASHLFEPTDLLSHHYSILALTLTRSRSR